jgi:hypothetical protein
MTASKSLVATLVAAAGIDAEELTLGPTANETELATDSPIGGDHSFYTYFVPGAIFQARDGSSWMIEAMEANGLARIRNVWYPREEATLAPAAIRASIDCWISPVQQAVAPLPDTPFPSEKSK